MCPDFVHLRFYQGLGLGIPLRAAVGSGGGFLRKGSFSLLRRLGLQRCGGRPFLSSPHWGLVFFFLLVLTQLSILSRSMRRTWARKPPAKWHWSLTTSARQLCCGVPQRAARAVENELGCLSRTTAATRALERELMATRAPPHTGLPVTVHRLHAPLRAAALLSSAPRCSSTPHPRLESFDQARRAETLLALLAVATGSVPCPSSLCRTVLVLTGHADACRGSRRCRSLGGDPSLWSGEQHGHASARTPPVRCFASMEFT